MVRRQICEGHKRLKFCLALIALAVCGCQDRAAKFLPSVVQAEAALTQSLEAWHAGMPAGEISGSKPAVHVTDNPSQRHRSLDSFKILGETAGRSGRTFAVELNLKQPDEKIRAEYIIVGIDPLWVFRREDYELLMHWDHRMPSLPETTDHP